MDLDPTRDRFISNYTRQNPTKSKIEALQEYNRQKSRNSEYVAGFTGNTSLSKLPADVQRNILAKTPGGRYSIVTAKQGNRPDRLEVSIRDLCDKQISVSEFKRYVRRIVKEVIEGKRKVVDVSFITGYGITTDQTEYMREERNRFVRAYEGDKRLPMIATLSIDAASKDTNFQVLSPFLGNDGTLSYSAITLYDNTSDIDNILDAMLVNDNFPNVPDVFVNVITAIEIFKERKQCKEIQIREFLETGYNYKEIVEQVSAPFNYYGTVNSKGEIAIRMLDLETENEDTKFIVEYYTSKIERLKKKLANKSPVEIEPEMIILRDAYAAEVTPDIDIDRYYYEDDEDEEDEEQ